MKHYKKDDVEMYHERGFRNALPSVNVKVYNFARGLTEEELNCDEDTFNKAVNFAFESAQEIFWEDAKETAKEIFGDHIKVYSAGRSAGHLIVQGLDDIASWDAIALSKWVKFEKAILSEIKYLSNKEYVKDEIIANQWNEPGAEQYNFIDKGNGETVVISELKKQAIDAGYGSIIR